MTIQCENGPFSLLLWKKKTFCGYKVKIISAAFFNDAWIWSRSYSIILFSIIKYSKTCLKRSLKKKSKIGFQDVLSLNAGQKYSRMFQGEHSAIISTFIKLHLSLWFFVNFEWLLKTGQVYCIVKWAHMICDHVSFKDTTFKKYSNV